jgi:hypothetical protein
LRLCSFIYDDNKKTRTESSVFGDNNHTTRGHVMTDKKNRRSTGANESRRDFLKKTGLGIGTAAALPAGFLAQVLEVKAAMQRDGQIIEQAAAKVESNARRGGKGDAISLVDQYRALGGSSRDVVQVLKGVDARLERMKAFQRYNKGVIDRAVEDAIIDYVGPQGSVAAGKSNLYDVKGSAAREMFERGGPRLKSHLTRAGVRIPGYNASRAPSSMRMQPQEMQQRMQQRMQQQFAPGAAEELKVNPGTVDPYKQR